MCASGSPQFERCAEKAVANEEDADVEARPAEAIKAQRHHIDDEEARGPQALLRKLAGSAASCRQGSSR